jgi:hypothetical protein
MLNPLEPKSTRCPDPDKFISKPREKQLYKGNVVTRSNESLDEERL